MSAKIKRIVPALLDWFSQNARDLPWRRTRDAYAIWVSEIMLQQTQVKTVIPFWERWMRELPTVEALAAAPPPKIHKLWEGLGYYTRVRNMQKAAQQIVERAHAAKLEKGEKLHLPALTPALSPRRGGNARSVLAGAGTYACSSSCARGEIGDSQSSSLRFRGRGTGGVEFPREFDAVLALPGVGRYTAGAICSIAFNQPTPILDGNVMRVLTRVFGISENPKEKETNARLWQLAEKLVRGAAACKVESRGWKEGGTGGTFNTQHSTPNVEVSCSYLNQSLMELGALVCTPRNPQCGGCPVKTLCVAFREGRVEELPNLDKRAAATARRFTAFVVERDGKFLVRQRPAGVVNGHLWEFPNVELTGARPVETPSGAVKRKLLRVTDPRSGAKTPDGAQGTDAPYQPNDFRIIDRKPLCTVKHSITRYRITLEAYRAEIAAGRLADDGGKGVTSVESRRGAAKRKLLRVTDPRSGGVWLALAQLDRLAFTSAHRKILERLLKV